MLLGKRALGHGKFTYGPPGGHLEFGESFEDCATREVMEETGLAITGLQFFAVTNDIFEEDNKHYVSIFMKSFPLDENAIPENREPHKHLEWGWFDLVDLPRPLFLPLKQLMARNPVLQSA